jgi:hypothetical protein
MGFRMQEDGKVLADRLVSQALHLLRSTSDHYVVAIGYRKPEELVAHRAADSVDLHAARSWNSDLLKPPTIFRDASITSP